MYTNGRIATEPSDFEVLMSGHISCDIRFPKELFKQSKTEEPAAAVDFEILKSKHCSEHIVLWKKGYFSSRIQSSLLIHSLTAFDCIAVLLHL